MKPEESVKDTIIDCAFDVLNEFGSGFLEPAYERSLQIALQKRNTESAQSRLPESDCR